MSNPLIAIKKLISPERQTAKVGIVTQIGAGGKLTVQTSSGANYTISGTAQINDQVLFDDSQIVCILERETLRTYYIK